MKRGVLHLVLRKPESLYARRRRVPRDFAIEQHELGTVGDVENFASFQFLARITLSSDFSRACLGGGFEDQSQASCTWLKRLKSGKLGTINRTRVQVAQVCGSSMLNPDLECISDQALCPARVQVILQL
jgi:hypothetical protein